MTELKQKPRRKIRGIYVTGVVALICACIPAWLAYRSQTHVTQVAQAYNFTGLVRSSTLKPISAAHIIFIQDEAAPENTYTDSNGSFTIRVRQDTVHLHLEVLAGGYLPFSENAPLHRTGPDDIRLKEQVSNTSSSQNHPRNRVAAPANVGGRTRQPAIKAPVQDCPGGICAGGSITGNPQITNNYGAPRPTPELLALEVEKLAPTSDFFELGPKQNPGASLTFRLSDVFPQPMFQIICARPCIATNAGAWPGANFTPSVYGIRGNPNATVVALSTAAVQLNQNVQITVRSLDDQQVQIESVKGLTQ